MYPIKFENLYYERIWGGKDLEKFRNNVPEGVIGESWDIACHKNGTGKVANGELKGKGFDEVIKEYGNKFLGNSISIDEDFPLLIKLITAKDKLSVQVHPNDEYAKRVENDLGKTEAWYVVDAEGCTLGRLASEVAKVLRGKNKPEYTPHVDTGDYVIVINADKVAVTGKKLDQKIYYSHSDYVGGMKEATLREMMAKKPEKVVELAVKGMLPKGPLGRQMFTKLHVYAGAEHAHAAQKPEVLTF